MNVAFNVNTGKLLARAASWRMASLLLERPRPGWHDEIETLSSEVADRELSACARGAKDGTEETYHRLFGPGGAVSPREVSYCGFEDPGRLMAELQSFYHAFSFAPRREEPIDHISVEAGFVGYLFLKQAYAEIRAAIESVKLTKTARTRFAAEHVGRCATGMLQGVNPLPSYLRSALLWMAEQAPNAPP